MIDDDAEAPSEQGVNATILEALITGLQTQLPYSLSGRDRYRWVVSSVGLAALCPQRVSASVRPWRPAPEWSWLGDVCSSDVVSAFLVQPLGLKRFF